MFLEDVGFVVSGGAVAIIAGFVAQLWHARHKDRSDVKKIQYLLKLDFVKLYKMAMKDRNTARKARKNMKNDTQAIHDMVGYIYRIGGGRFRSLVWPPITLSGKMLKMKNEDIEIIQLIQDGVIKYNSDMIKIQEERKIKLNSGRKSDTPIPAVFTFMILGEYFDEYDKNINELLDKFKELKKLAWFDYGSLNVRCRTSTVNSKDKTNNDMMFNVDNSVLELKTRHELINACINKGYILIIRRPAKDNRIHSTSCKTLHIFPYDLAFLNRKDYDLVTGKSKRWYFFSESLSMLEDKIKTEAIRATKCKMCN